MCPGRGYDEFDFYVMQLFKGGTIKNILSNTLWMLFDKLFILILNLVVTVKVANYYGTTDYGVYQYAVSVIAIFEILLTFVDGRVIKKRYLTTNPQQLVWTATLIRILFAGVSLLGGVIYLFLCNETHEYNVIFCVLLCNAVITNMRFGMQNRYEYLLKSKKVIIVVNIALSIGAVLQLIAVHLHLRIVFVAYITLFTSFVSFVIIYFQYKKEFGTLLCKKVDKLLIKNIILDSTPLAVAASCAIIYSRCDSIMIGNMLSKSDVGIYAIAVKLITIVQMGISPIRESVYPKMIELYDTDKKQYAKRYVQITAILTWVYIIGVLVSFLILPFILNCLNEEYSEAFPIYQIYVLGSFFMYNAGLRAGHYTLINKGSILMYSQITSVVINFVLNYIMIPYIGLYGAAAATVITQGISLLVSNICFGKVGLEVFKWQIQGLNPIYVLKK